MVDSNQNWQTFLKPFESSIPENMKLAYLPETGVIKLRLTGTGTDQESLSSAVNEQAEKLYKIIPEIIYGEDEVTLEMVIGKLLKSKNKTLCTAESCTGGEIAHMITSVAGSSSYYQGSVIAYSNSVKTQLLGVQDSNN